MKKILFITPYNSTFIHNQICKINKKNNITSKTYLIYNSYYYLRNRTYREHILGNFLTRRIEDLIYCPYLTLPKMLLHHWSYYSAFMSVLHRIHNFQFDLIHAHTILPAGFVAMKLSKRFNKPYIVTIHGSDFYKTNYKISNLRNIRPYSLKEIKTLRSTFENASKIISVSKYLTKEIKNYFQNNKTVTIENNFAHHLFYPGDKKKTRGKLGIGKDKKVILSIGNFTKTKGHDVLIQALPKLLHKHDLILYLIGSGDLIDKYRNMIRELKILNSVKIIPYQPQFKLREWYVASDCFVLPSLHESFGIVILEAMACNIPVVATETPGPLSIIKHEREGLLVKPGNVNELTKAIDNILTYKLQSDYYIRNANILVNAKYSQETDNLIKLYNEVLNEKNSVI
jgi:glycosyltransferase involved in cell wall biosynthesis